MDGEEHGKKHGYVYIQANSYTTGARKEELARIKRHKRYVSMKHNGPAKCNCVLDNNGFKCYKKAKLEVNGKLIEKDGTCINKSYNYECNPTVCGKGCLNQELQTFCAKNDFGPVYVKNAGRFGLGLFASKRIPAGTVLGEYVGKVKCQKKQSPDVDSDYAFGIGDGFSGRSDLLIDAAEFGNFMRFANHSCQPNCSTQQVIVGTQFRIIVKSTEKIRRGAQVTISYGNGYFSFGRKCDCRRKGCISASQRNQIKD